MPRTAERIISVGGGKGGVGKSVIAANLSIAMAQSGRRVVLVDGDLGAANQHTMFGIDRPGPTLHGLFTHQIARLDEALIPSGVAGLSLVPGSGAVAGAANLNHGQKVKLGNHIRSLDADVVVIDVGAGVHFNTLDLYGLADLRVLVTSPQLTSIQNAYAFLKASALRALRQVADGAAEVALFEEQLPPRETDRVPRFIERVRERDPAFAARLDQALGGFRARLVGNMVYDRREEGVFHAVSRMIRDFLGVEAPVLGFLRDSRAIHGSVNRRRALLADGTPDEAAETLRSFARALLAIQVEARRSVPRDAPLASAAQLPDENLPASLSAYRRRHDRYAVLWRGGLAGEAGPVAVTVREVSLGGALVEVPHPVAVGTRSVLTLHQLAGAPSVPLIVRNVRGDGLAIGIEFMPDGELPRALVEAIQEHAGVTPTPVSADRAVAG